MTASGFVYWLEDCAQTDNELVGKKCANLGEMIRAGIPVPQGFALSCAAYETFLADTGALAQINDYLSKYPNGLQEHHEFEEASRAIREIVLDKNIPQAIESLVTSFYQQMGERCGTENPVVAVRSSGPVSRPGMFDSYLNIYGLETLKRKIVECWASTYTPRALAFRAQKGLPLAQDPIGVGVIEMVSARAAGVLFTLDPVSGNQKAMVIEGIWGLGEGVVGGLITPDQFVLDKDSLAVTKQWVAKKPVAIASLPSGGTAEQEVPLEQQDAPCLSADELTRLGRLGLTIEQHYGRPQDIEWVVAEGPTLPRKLVVLQSRPITVWAGMEKAQ